MTGVQTCALPISNLPVFDALNRLDVAIVEAALQAGNDAEFLLLGQVACLLHEPHAARINAVGLFGEHVPACLDRRHGAEFDIFTRHDFLGV